MPPNAPLPRRAIVAKRQRQWNFPKNLVVATDGLNRSFWRLGKKGIAVDF
jgi:hypothetical protein